MIYQLDVAGINSYFSECQNVGITHEIIEYKEGEDIRKRRGKRYSTQITIKRAVTGDMSLWDWYKANMASPNYYNATLTAYDQSYNEIARWNMTKVWPSRLVIESDLNGENSYEVLTIIYEDFQRVN